MKKVYQTITNAADGNCMEACLASLLEIDISDVPKFSKKEEWYDECQAFLAKYDLYLLCFDFNEPRFDLLLGYCIASCSSPNYKDVDHAVILHNGRVFHDPHRDGKPVDLSRIKTIDVLVKKCEVKINNANPI